MQTTSKTDVFAFGVVLAELITGQPALARDKKDPKKFKTLISVVSPNVLIYGKHFNNLINFYRHIFK